MKKLAVFFLSLFTVLSVAAGVSFTVDSESDWNEGTFYNATGDPDLKIIEDWDYTDTKLDDPFDQSGEVQGLYNGSNGRVYVADTLNGEIDVYHHKNWSFIESHGVTSWINSPMDVYRDSGNGDIYVIGAAPDNDGVVQFDSNWNADTIYSLEESQVGVKMSGLRGFYKEESTGNWYLADYLQGQIVETDSGFSSGTTLVDDLNNPADIYKWIIPGTGNDRWQVLDAGSNQIVEYIFAISGNADNTYDISNQQSEPRTLLEGDTYWWLWGKNANRFDKYYRNVSYPSGAYQSKTFDAGQSTYWYELDTDVSVPGDSHVNITVETSTDDFSTVADSQTFTFLGPGEETRSLDGLEAAAQYIRYNLSLMNGSSPTVDTVTLQGDNTPPQYQNLADNTSQNLVRKNGSVNLTVEGKDDGTGAYQFQVATNETGTWENKTAAYHDGFEDGDISDWRFPSNQDPDWFNASNTSISGRYGVYWENLESPDEPNVYSSFINTTGDVAFQLNLTSDTSDSNDLTEIDLRDGGSTFGSLEFYYSSHDVEWVGTSTSTVASNYWQVNKSIDVYLDLDFDSNQVEIFLDGDSKGTYNIDSASEVEDIEFKGSWFGGNVSGVLDELRVNPVYDSPNIFENIANQWVRSTFTWLNTSFRSTAGYRVWGKDAEGQWSKTGTQQFTVDTERPSTRNQNNPELTDMYDATTLAAQAKDNLRLDNAILSTNESGSWSNKTTPPPADLGDHTGDTFDVSQQNTQPRGIHFHPGEDRWYKVGDDGDNVYVYYANWTYTGTMHNIGNEDPAPVDLWHHDSTWYLLTGNEWVYEYTDTWTYTGTRHNLSHGTPISPDVTVADTYGFGYNEDTERWAVVEYKQHDDVFEFYENWTYTGNRYDVGSEDNEMMNVWPRPDQQAWYAVGWTTDTVYKYDQDWTYTGTSDSISEVDNPRGLHLRPDEGLWYITNNDDNKIYSYYSNYVSPKHMDTDQDTWLWSNFSWRKRTENIGLTAKSLVGWKIYYNDTSGNTVSTATDTFMADFFPEVHDIVVWNQTYDRKTRIDYNNTVHVRVNVTDEDGRDDIDAVLLNLTDPAGNVEVKNQNMSRIKDNITVDGEEAGTYEYNHSLSVATEDSGTWDVDVWVNDTEGGTDRNSSTFIYQLYDVSIVDTTQGSADIFSDIPFTREYDVENPSNTDFVNGQVVTSVPTDIRTGSTTLETQGGSSITHAVNGSAGELTFRRSISANTRPTYDFSYDVQNLSVNQSNFTTVDDREIQYFEYNMTPRGPTDFVDLDAFQDLPEPERISEVKLYENGTDVTNDADYEFETLDTNSDGDVDRAEWIVPTVNHRTDHELEVVRGEPLQIDEDNVILNAPVTRTKRINWRKGLLFQNFNDDFALEVSEKIRMPLEASEIVVSSDRRITVGDTTSKEILADLRFDSQGPYIPVSFDLPRETNETVFIEFSTPAIDIETERFQPDHYWADKDDEETINATFENPYDLEISEEAQISLNILEASDLTATLDGDVIDTQDFVEGDYTLNVSNISANSDVTVSVDFTVPVADVEFLGTRNISSGNELYVWDIQGTSPVQRDKVKFETQKFDCVQVVDAFVIATNESKEVECGDEIGETVVDLGSLTDGDSFQLAVERRPYIPYVDDTRIVTRMIANNSLVAGLLLLALLITVVGLERMFGEQVRERIL